MTQAVTFVIFGATGHLSPTKLLPSLAKVIDHENLSAHAVIGVGSRERSTEDFVIGQIPLAVSYDDILESAPDAYETLLADVIWGDQTLFVRSDEVEAAWKLYDPLLDRSDIHTYAAGSNGPESTERLIVTEPGIWTTI